MQHTAITITNKLGLHARAAARFVKVASRFSSDIRVGINDRMVDGKSIMGVLMLAAARGTQLTLSADGKDEENAIKALAALVNTRFGEHE